MRWVGNRITTEEEDMVYCLLGLLGISIPIAYGEGQESARRRLQAELDATGSVPSIIPFLQNKSFVGRESQLVELKAKLFSNDQTTTTLSIVGPGGTGKSQLALEVTHRTRLSNKDCSVFWMDASDIDSLSQSYASVAQRLSVPGCNDDQADIKQVVKRCVAAISTRHCLLIFDNVDGTTLRPSGSSTTRVADLADFLPHSKLCSVIFTTTESNTAEALAPRNVTALHELTPDTALRMLRNRLTMPLSDAEQQDAMHLLSNLSHLPLAVVQAAACMNASHMTVQHYQAQLDQHKKAALKYSDDSFEGEQGKTSLRNTVAAILSLSMSQVCQSNADAAEYLFVAACVDRKDISLDLLEAASLQAREETIKVLDRYALVTRRPAESALDVHRLVHYALRKRMVAEGRLQEWIKRTTKQLFWLFPNDDHSNRSKWRRLLPHAQYVLSHSQKDDDDEKLDLARKCAMTLYIDGQYKRAEELQVQVMQTRKRVLGDEHPDTLVSMNNLASTYKSQGRWKDAEELQVQVMQITKRVLGHEHPHTLTSVSNLGLVLERQGKYEEAEAMHRRALEGYEKVLGREHPHTLNSVYNLAYLLAKLCDYKESLDLYNRACSGYSIVLREHHPTTQACRQHRSEVLALQEQSPVVFSAAAPEKSVSAPTRTVLRLSRGLAHLGIGGFGLVWFGLVILLGFSRVLRSYARSDRLWQTADAARTLIRATPLHPSRGTICLQRPAVFCQPLSTICLAAHLDTGSY
jgi:tetratricopeptide (TPR) repeat protein